MDKNLLAREAYLEAESIELHERLRRAKEKNLPESIILSIEDEIKRNDVNFEILMVGINAELEGRFRYV